MERPAPTIHSIPPDADPSELLRELTNREGERERGVHVVVLVAEGGNVAHARIKDSGSPGDGSQRWLQHARRGSSPGGWTERHHPRNERDVGEWKQRHAGALDRLLIECSKDAWRLEHDAPYLAQFAPVSLAEAGIDPGSDGGADRVD